MLFVCFCCNIKSAVLSKSIEWTLFTIQIIFLIRFLNPFQSSFIFNTNIELHQPKFPDSLRQFFIMIYIPYDSYKCIAHIYFIRSLFPFPIGLVLVRINNAYTFLYILSYESNTWKKKNPDADNLGILFRLWIRVGKVREKTNRLVIIDMRYISLCNESTTLLLFK